MNNQKPKVYFSYAYSDRHKIQKIKQHFLDQDFEVFTDHEIQFGVDWQKELQYRFENSNFLLVFFTPSLLERDGLSFEFTDDFFSITEKRNIYLYPVIFEQCKLPIKFETYDVFDLSDQTLSSLKDLTERMKTVYRINFDNFSSQQFEDLTGDLLNSLNFKNIQRPARGKDFGLDFIAEFYYKDPFGINEKEIWAVESKLYKHARFDLTSIKKILDGYRFVTRRDAKLLLVTNSNLNSVAKRYLEEIRDSAFIDVRVIEGFQLKNIIAKNPSVVNKYFAS